MIKEFDSTTTFFYVDPSYGTSKDYDNYISPQQMYNDLKNIIGRFVLSYNDSPNIRNFLKEYNIYEIKTKYSTTKYLFF